MTRTILAAVAVTPLVLSGIDGRTARAVSPTPGTGATLQPAASLQRGVCGGAQQNCRTVATFDGTFHEAALSIRWNAPTRRLAYGRQLKDGYYDIFTSNEDGTDERPLTVDHPDLPNRHQGAPFWHPGGKYIIFLAEKRKHKGASRDALPGYGGYSDIWVITADGKRVWRLTDLPDDYSRGALFPMFSPDGRQVLWTEREKAPNFLSTLTTAGTHAFKIANFVERPEPHFEAVRRIQPGTEGFYEASDLSGDGRTVLFTSNFETKNFWKNQIYSYDLSTGTSKRLTVDGYNEHPGYTPDGRHIIYMSNHQVDRLKLWPGADWWVMDADGGNKQRLGFMNKKGHPHSNGSPMWAGPVAWSPDGGWFYGDVQTTLLGQQGKIVKVGLRCECR